MEAKLFIDGRLYTSFAKGQARDPAYLDDYAFCLQACLELLASDWQTRHLTFAVQLVFFWHNEAQRDRVHEQRH